MYVLAADPTVQIAFFGIVTTIITVIGGVVVAVVNNKRERGNSAESAMEATLRERIVLRDEQIEDLRNDIAERDHTIEKLNEELRLFKDGRLP